MHHLVVWIHRSCDKLLLQQDAEGYQYGTANGRLASFRQKRDGIDEWVALTGLGDRFQIWSREAFQAHRAAQRLAAREGLALRRSAA